MKFIILILSVIISVILSVYILFPLVPSEWNELRIGMTEDEVFKLIRGTYSQPSGLASNEIWLKSKEFTFSHGQYQYVAGKVIYLKVKYDNTGEVAGRKRVLMSYEITGDRKNFIRWVEGFGDIYQ